MWTFVFIAYILSRIQARFPGCPRTNRMILKKTVGPNSPYRKFRFEEPESSGKGNVGWSPGKFVAIKSHPGGCAGADGLRAAKVWLGCSTS